MYYCIVGGYEHRERSRVGRRHSPMDTRDKDWLTPKKLAVGVSMANAMHTRDSGNTAALEWIEGEWDVSGFDDQFGNFQVLREQLRDWNRNNVIGKTRHSGKTWYEFLANDWDADPMPPERFAMFMKDKARWYRRLSGR